MQIITLSNGLLGMATIVTILLLIYIIGIVSNYYDGGGISYKNILKILELGTFNLYVIIFSLVLLGVFYLIIFGIGHLISHFPV